MSDLKALAVMSLSQLANELARRAPGSEAELAASGPSGKSAADAIDLLARVLETAASLRKLEPESEAALRKSAIEAIELMEQFQEARRARERAQALAAVGGDQPSPAPNEPRPPAQPAADAGS